MSGASKSRASVSLLAWALAGGCGGGGKAQDPFADRHTSWRRARVVVADADVGRLSVFDAEDEEVIAVVDVPAPVKLDVSHTGDHGLLIGPHGLGLLWSGVSIVDHVDHIHIYKFQPKLRPFTLGVEPVAGAGSHDGWIGALFGGARSVALTFREEALLTTSEPPVSEWPGPTEAPMSLAIPFAGTVLAVRDGTANPALVALDSPTPNAAGTALLRCSDPRGARSTPSRAAVACLEGIAIIEKHAPDAASTSTPALTAAMAAYPGSPGSPRSTITRAHPAIDVVVADAGPRAFLRVDRGSGGTQTAAIVTPALSADVCSFDLEQKDGKRIVVLGADGRMRSFDLEGRDVRTGPEIVRPFACDASGVSPQMALAPERAYVADPRTGRLHDVDLRTLALARSYDIGGRPGSIAVLAIDLKNANVAPGAEHGPDGSSLDGPAADAGAQDGDGGAVDVGAADASLIE